MNTEAPWILLGALLFVLTGPVVVQGQDALQQLDFTVLVPAGGLDADGNPADLQVQPGDVLLSLVQSENDYLEYPLCGLYGLRSVHSLW